MMTKLKEAAVSLSLTALALALSLTLVEIAFRLYKGEPLLSTRNLLQERIDLIRVNTGAVVHDPLLGWRLREGVKQPGGMLTTGEFGVRMNQGDIVPLPSSGMLAVGDSFTAGSLVRDEEAWPARLEMLTGRRVVNGSSGGYGVDQMVLRAEQLLHHFAADTLLIGILSQDNLRNNYSVFGGGYKPYFRIENDRLVLEGVPTPRVDERPLEMSALTSFLGRSHAFDFAVSALGIQERLIDHRTRYRQVHEIKEGPRISCLLMDRVVSLKREKNLRVIVLVMYGASEIETREPLWHTQPVVDCAREKGLEVLDTRQPILDILEHDRAAFVRLWIDEGGQLGHPSAEGHQFLATLLHDAFFRPGITATSPSAPDNPARLP